MENNQHKFIEYVEKFAEVNKCHIWLGGSFLHGGATLFSDVDISVFCTCKDLIELIYGYGKPVYISYTHKPLGILIVIYEDGVAVDLEIIETMNIEGVGYFHTDDIKAYNYIRSEKICRELSLRSDTPYQVSRLFHRSLIKFLSGKREIGVRTANEIATFLDPGSLIDESGYANSINDLLKSFDEQYHLPFKYYNILRELIEKLNDADCK
ncbi:MAG: hypothetical protein E7554_01505 [Ruminococcaceae bacterium]|nr:hypothetical protein [Oscillospiraceae bacterium]